MNRFSRVGLGAALVLLPLATRAATFRLLRVADNLTFPSCITQAPGDTNSLYIVENVVTNSPNNKPGRILRHDLSAGTNSVFFDLSSAPGANNNNRSEEHTSEL